MKLRSSTPSLSPSPSLPHLISAQLIARCRAANEEQLQQQHHHLLTIGSPHSASALASLVPPLTAASARGRALEELSVAFSVYLLLFFRSGSRLAHRELPLPGPVGTRSRIPLRIFLKRIETETPPRQSPLLTKAQHTSLPSGKPRDIGFIHPKTAQ